MSGGGGERMPTAPSHTSHRSLLAGDGGLQDTRQAVDQPAHSARSAATLISFGILIRSQGLKNLGASSEGELCSGNGKCARAKRQRKHQPSGQPRRFVATCLMEPSRDCDAVQTSKH